MPEVLIGNYGCLDCGNLRLPRLPKTTAQTAAYVVFVEYVALAFAFVFLLPSVFCRSSNDSLDAALFLQSLQDGLVEMILLIT